MRTRLPGNRRLALAIAAVLALVALVGVAAAVRGGGDDGAPSDDAARLVPASALVYLHLSTDTDRSETDRARDLATRFPSFARVRDSLLKRLSAPGCNVDVKKLTGGREAALALIDTGATTAGSLVLVDTGSDEKAPDRSCGGVQTARLGRFVAIGQKESIAAARNLESGEGGSLAADPLYRRGQAALPSGRVADGWVTAAGVRRLLVPQSGVLGVAGVLVDQPGLRGAALGLTTQDKGAKLTIKSLLDPKTRRRDEAFRPFDPSLQTSLPDAAVASLQVSGLSSAATRLLGLAGPSTAALAPLLARAGADLAPLAQAFSGEVAVTITPAVPAPILSLVAKAPDEERTARQLRRAEGALARLLKPADGAVARWTRSGGVSQLKSGGVELDYAVFDEKVVVATKRQGIDLVRREGKRLPDSGAWSRTVGKAPDDVTSLVFLDFSQLLRLAEQTGLNDSRAYLAVKDDLRRITAVGARSSSAGDESTAEILLSIP